MNQNEKVESGLEVVTGLLREIRRHNSSGLTKDMQNRIDAALSQQAEPERCTCPSGDGSLRWPCPTHKPAPANQATDGGRNPRYEGLFEGETEQQRAERLASVQAAPQPEQIEPNQRTLQWVVDRWHAEVANRPLVNVHRRTLDSTWRQMIRHLGEDDVVLLGPRHDDMLDASGNPLPQYAAALNATQQENSHE